MKVKAWAASDVGNVKKHNEDNFFVDTTHRVIVVADGVRIGRDVIIGAGAVVIGEVPDFHIAAGVPAKIMRDRRAVFSGKRDPPI